jgi:hypothetical protein
MASKIWLKANWKEKFFLGKQMLDIERSACFCTKWTCKAKIRLGKRSTKHDQALRIS